MDVLLRLDRLARMSPTWLSPDLYDRPRRWWLVLLGVALLLWTLLLGLGAALVL